MLNNKHYEALKFIFELITIFGVLFGIGFIIAGVLSHSNGAGDGLGIVFFGHYGLLHLLYFISILKKWNP